MLTCLASFFFLGFVFCLSCLVNNGLSWVLVCGVGWWLVRVFLACSGVFLFVWWGCVLCWLVPGGAVVCPWWVIGLLFLVVRVCAL